MAGFDVKKTCGGYSRQQQEEEEQTKDEESTRKGHGSVCEEGRGRKSTGETKSWFGTKSTGMPGQEMVVMLCRLWQWPLAVLNLLGGHQELWRSGQDLMGTGENPWPWRRSRKL